MIHFITSSLKVMILMIKMKPIIKEDRINMVKKSAKMLLAHLIKEDDIIKGQQVIDPVEILLNLILEEEILWITKQMFQDIGYDNHYSTGKRTTQISYFIPVNSAHKFEKFFGKCLWFFFLSIDVGF